MKSKRPSFPRSAQALQRRIPGNRDRALPESKCPACGQTVNTMMDRSLEGDETVVAFPSSPERMTGKFDKKHPANATDLEKVLHFSQQLYAHALTLQELIRNEGRITYEVLRPRYDRQAAQQFELFYRALERPSGLRKPAAGSCEW
jgi:hypothetical protein